jgi:hypothetical protein
MTVGRGSQIGPTLGQAVCNRVAYQGVPGAYSEQVTADLRVLPLTPPCR